MKKILAALFISLLIGCASLENKPYCEAVELNMFFDLRTGQIMGYGMTPEEGEKWMRVFDQAAKGECRLDNRVEPETPSNDSKI
jgi:hypothetical protein